MNALYYIFPSMAPLFCLPGNRKNGRSLRILPALPVRGKDTIVILKLPCYCDCISSQNLNFLRNSPNAFASCLKGHLLSSSNFPGHFLCDRRPGSHRATTGIGRTYGHQRRAESRDWCWVTISEPFLY